MNSWVGRWGGFRLERSGGLALVVLAATALIFPGLGGFALLDPNEAKHALIAKNTMEAGQWLEPVLNGTAYHHKPSLFYILVGACYRAFGVSEAAARLVPALSAWTTLVATYWFGSRRSVPAGLLAAYFLASSLFFVHLGRFTNLDGVFTAALTIALFSTLAAEKRVARDSGRWRIPYLAFVLAALATLIKGPVALVLLAVPACFAAARRELDWRRIAIGVVVVVCIVSAWALPVWLAHPDYLRDFVWLHNLQRYFGDVEKFHPEPALFFIPITFAALLPWSPLIPLAVVRALRCRDSEFYLAVYALAVIAFFSLSSGKLATYVVPSFPPLAVLTAWWAWGRLSEPGSRGLSAALAGAGVVALLAPAALIAAVIVDPSVAWAASCFVPASGVAAAVLVRRRFFSSGADVSIAVASGCLATSVLVSAFGGIAAERLTSDRDLAELARAMGRPDRMVIYRVRPFSFLYYTGWTGVYKVSDEEYRHAIEDGVDAEAAVFTLILTKEKRLEPLAQIAPGVEFETVARNRRHLLLRPVSAQSP